MVKMKQFLLFYFRLPEFSVLVLVGAEQSNRELKDPVVCCVPNMVSLFAFAYYSFPT